MGEVISFRVGGFPITMVIVSGFKYNLLGQDASNYLQEKGAAKLNLRTESTNQFWAYAAISCYRFHVCLNHRLQLEGMLSLLQPFM